MKADEKLNNKKNKIYAVLTGDIIGSSGLPSDEFKTVMQTLRTGTVNFSKSFPGSVFGKLDVFSGDGWQVLINDYSVSIRTALYLRALVKSYEKNPVDTRIAIAWGSAEDTTFNPERISESMGEVFTKSGRALSEMKKNCNMALIYGRNFNDSGMCLSAIHLLDELVSRWSAIQARTIALVLLNQSQEDIAYKFNKKQSTINQALQSAGWRGIKSYLTDVENRQKSLY